MKAGRPSTTQKTTLIAQDTIIKLTDLDSSTRQSKELSLFSKSANKMKELKIDVVQVEQFT